MIALGGASPAAALTGPPRDRWPEHPELRDIFLADAWRYNPIFRVGGDPEGRTNRGAGRIPPQVLILADIAGNTSGQHVRQQIFPIGALLKPLAKLLQLVARDEALAIGDFLGASDLETLAALKRCYEIGRI